MRFWMQAVRNVVLLGQIGFSLVTPPVVMGLLGWWLQARFGLGVWCMALCLIVGVMSSVASALRLYRRLMSKLKQEDRKWPVTFYDHD